MNHAIRIHAHGGPEAMVWEEVPVPTPKPDEVLVRHKAVGLNYIDVYFRTGLYKVPQLPVTLGMEGAYQGMRHGYVDDTWAREHHDLWYEQIQSGEIPRVRTQPPPGDEPAPLKV